MVSITKSEARELNSRYKIRYGENGISKSGTGRHYYLCESEWNMKKLNKLRKLNTVKY